MTRKFWSRFAHDHWEKQPALLRQPFVRPFITPQEIFRAVIEASGRYRAQKEIPLAFYIEHARQIASVVDYLPVAADGNMERYAKRISTQLCGRRFALIVEHIQAYDAQLWMRFREFLRGLGEAVPSSGVNRKATVFVGPYAMTPSGLHVGTSGNFKFIVSGRKRMRLWPDAFFRDKKGVNHTVHIKPFLSEATTLEGEAGDVIYWPSDQWHVGEAVDGNSVSVSLAIFVKSRAPKSQVAWLNRQTGAGFAHVPEPLVDRSLSDRALVRCDPRYPLVWQASKNSEIVCSASGHAFAFQADDEILALLTRLNLGGTECVRDLIAPRPALRVVLQKLLRLRAISEVESRG